MIALVIGGLIASFAIGFRAGVADERAWSQGVEESIAKNQRYHAQTHKRRFY